jgi:hypothetical protein
MKTFEQLVDGFADRDDSDEATARGRLLNANTALRFMLGGNATITIRSRRTGTRFTYKLKAAEDGAITFVSVLTGPDNGADYAYLGYVKRDVYWHGKKSRIAASAPSAVAFNWTYRQLVKRHMPDALELWHEGSCGRCGRKLTDPTSIESGFGPECITKIGF